jgi:hypothetical protein
MSEDPSGLPAWSGLERPRPLLVGWKEYVDFPDWGIRRVKVKVDTGARTSALDVVEYELRRLDSQGLMIRLHLQLKSRHPDRLAVVEVPVLQMVAVTNPCGVREERPVIETRVRLGPISKIIRLTITNRSAMRFRMILGRLALANDFVVDVSKKYLLARGEGRGARGEG